MPVQRNITAHFSRNPVTIDKTRSTFDRSCTYGTTFNVGDLFPIYLDQDILPGDTLKVDTTSLLRMNTPLVPVMDNCYFDYFWFFIPNRLVWNDWEQFMGQADPAAYTSPTVPVFPTVTVTPLHNNLAGYFSLPQGRSMTVSALPFRAYRMVYNEWFRNQNTQNYLTISKNSGVDANASAYLNVVQANKYADWFTSALPATQKGLAVNLLSQLTTPVKSSLTQRVANDPAIVYGTSTLPSTTKLKLLGLSSLGSNAVEGSIGDVIDISADDTFTVKGPQNLYVDLASAAFSVNSLRLAVQTQRLLELDARGGSLYIQQIFSHFGIKSSDARLQRPEYLGGGHVTVNMMQVLQQSATSGEPTPVGYTGAYSKTLHGKHDFERSFTEHGIVMCLACVRTAQSYSQGIEPGWLRRDRFDYYFPTLANIGEQPILNKYIYYQNNATLDNQVFGYGEAWADYRTNRSHMTGLLSPDATNPLDLWHYGNKFTSLPTLSDVFSRQDRAAFLRSVADPSAPDFVGNFYFQVFHTRVMPTYSIPGLVDHF